MINSSGKTLSQMISMAHVIITPNWTCVTTLHCAPINDVHNITWLKRPKSIELAFWSDNRFYSVKIWYRRHRYFSGGLQDGGGWWPHGGAELGILNQDFIGWKGADGAICSIRCLHQVRKPNGDWPKPPVCHNDGWTNEVSVAGLRLQ